MQNRFAIDDRRIIFREGCMSVRFVAAAAAMFALASTSLVPAAGTLDYDYYKAKVQPIFLAKRSGHARCVMCHAEANNMLRLEKLPDGQAAYTEEQTRKNFEMVSKIVQAVDDPLKSKILINQLPRDSGADASTRADASSPPRTTRCGKRLPTGPRARHCRLA